MNHVLVPGLVAAWAAILVVCWLGWQLLRQNGRVLLRLDELEKRLNETEFGGQDEPEGLQVGAEAPTFELPDLAGGRHSLPQFHGQPALLAFFNPGCGFCHEMMPKLAALPPHPVERGEGGRSPGEGPPLLIIISTGDADKNRQFFAEYKVGCPVLLQNDGEVAKTYRANGTPSGYLISPEGKIASELAIGTDALLALAEGRSEIGNPKSEMEPTAPAKAADDVNGRAGRFGNRSLARSKIKRDGLKAGTPAPDFRLPRLDGRGELALEDLRGRGVLLVFSDPHCGPCNALAPELEKFYRNNNQSRCSQPSPNSSHEPLAPSLSMDYSPAERPLTPSLSPGGGEGVRRTGEGNYPDTTVVMISRGEPKENRAKVKEHGLTFPVVLQQQWEISRRYAMFATPIAYLIDEAGVIGHDVAVGIDAIRELTSLTESLAVSKRSFEPSLELNS